MKDIYYNNDRYRVEFLNALTETHPDAVISLGELDSLITNLIAEYEAYDGSETIREFARDAVISSD